MKFIYTKLIIALSLVNCACSNENGVKVSLVPVSENHSLLKSGKYGDISLAVNGDTVSGVYEYYDKWNSKLGDFEDINVFYFFGLIRGGDSVKLNTGWPDEQCVDGVLRIGDVIQLKLKDQPNGYAAVDFVESGYFSGQTEEKAWTSIGVIKQKKVYLHNKVSDKPTKAYLISGDIVKIINRESDWVKVEYTSRVARDRIIFGWIPAASLFAVNPSEWGTNNNN